MPVHNETWLPRWQLSALPEQGPPDTVADWFASTTRALVKLKAAARTEALQALQQLSPMLLADLVTAAPGLYASAKACGIAQPGTPLLNGIPAARFEAQAVAAPCASLPPEPGKLLALLRKSKVLPLTDVGYLVASAPAIPHARLLAGDWFLPGKSQRQLPDILAHLASTGTPPEVLLGFLNAPLPGFASRTPGKDVTLLAEAGYRAETFMNYAAELEATLDYFLGEIPAEQTGKATWPAAVQPILDAAKTRALISDLLAGIPNPKSPLRPARAL